MMDRICEVYIEDLGNERPDRKLAAFLYYYQQNSTKIKSQIGEKEVNKKFLIKEIEEQDKNKPQNEKDEKEFLFNRSH